MFKLLFKIHDIMYNLYLYTHINIFYLLKIKKYNKKSDFIDFVLQQFNIYIYIYISHQ